MDKRYLFQCENCSTKFYIGEDAVKVYHNVPYKMPDGKRFWITYYDCPKCEKRHYVQIDDVRSNQMKKQVSILFKKLSKKRLEYKDIPKQQNERFKKLNKDLEDYRFELKKKFDGKVFVSERGEKEEIHFSM